jgi:hypothetical protein
MAKACPKATVLEPLALSRDGGPDGEASVSKWLEGIGLA